MAGSNELASVSRVDALVGHRGRTSKPCPAAWGRRSVTEGDNIMADLEFGPVELVLAAFEGDTPKGGVLEPILDLGAAGPVRLLDLVYVTRSDEGEIDWVELDESGIELGGIDLAANGVASAEDLAE